MAACSDLFLLPSPWPPGGDVPSVPPGPPILPQRCAHKYLTCIHLPFSASDAN